MAICANPGCGEELREGDYLREPDHDAHVNCDNPTGGPLRETVSKTIFTLEVLHPADVDVSSWPLESVLSEMDTGHAVGNVTGLRTDPVPDEAVEDELRALGNDGHFFDLEDG